MVGLSDIKAFGQASGKDADGNSTGNYEGAVFNDRLGTAFSFGIRFMLLKKVFSKGVHYQSRTKGL